MTKTVKLLVVLIMLISLPVRGIAAVTADLCGHQETVVHGEAAQQHGGEHHHRGGLHGDHCGSTSFAAAAAPVPHTGPSCAERISSGNRVAAGFVPDHLDPPPLAL